MGRSTGSTALTSDVLRQNADFALYHAKDISRGGYCRFEKGMRTVITDRIQTIRDVGQALADNRILTHYQPIVNLRTAEIVGLEALARMKTLDGRIVAAGSFQAALSDSKVAYSLTDCVLRQVARDVRHWLDLGVPFQHVGINFSAADFIRGDFETRLSGAFESQSVSLKHVVLEVTESVHMGGLRNTIARSLERLRATGMLVALDDFGTGFASLTHLLSFPVDVIKIDKIFIDRLLTDHPSEVIVGSLIDLASKLGFKIVAEGIECAAQQDRLVELGCSLGQGFYFARPADVPDDHPAAAELCPAAAVRCARQPDRIDVGASQGSRLGAARRTLSAPCLAGADSRARNRESGRLKTARRGGARLSPRDRDGGHEGVTGTLFDTLPCALLRSSASCPHVARIKFPAVAGRAPLRGGRSHVDVVEGQAMSRAAWKSATGNLAACGARMVLSMFLLLAGAALAGAQQAQPDKVDTLLQLLADPDVKSWLAARQSPPDAAVAETPAAATPVSLSVILDTVKGHLREMADAVPKLPGQFARAWTILELEFEEEGLLGIVALILGFVAVGFGLDWVVRRLATPYRNWMKALPYNTPQGRVKNLGARLVYASMLIGTFVLGTAGVFLAFTWPPLLREIVLGYLSVAIVTRATMMVVRAFLMPPSLGLPQAPHIRVFPMTDERAEHWYRWIGINVFWLVFVVVTFSLMGTFGFDTVGRFALSIPTSFIQLVLILLMIWRRPRQPAAELHKPPAIGRTGWTWLLSVYFTLVWLIQIGGTWKLYWLVIALAALPATIMMAHRGVTFLLRDPDPDAMAPAIAPVLVAVVDRAIRLLLILAAAYVLIKAWGLEITSMTAGDAFTNRILRGLLNAVVIVLAADFGWSIVKAIIAKRLGTLEGPVMAGHGMDPQQARLKTLLPIFQNILFAAIFTMAVLMALSALGIDIAPMVAGAGVVGIAVGFGAQTLVKDIVSGVFFLFDDAFRVGEYIQSGSYKGTVESPSACVRCACATTAVRSITVPFGELGAVQNMSRDWVIDKLSIGITYDSDLEKARKLIKKIGQELAADPEYGAEHPGAAEDAGRRAVRRLRDPDPHEDDDPPGEQFVIRRKAYAAIKTAFDANGIRIPYPTVHVRDGESPNHAAAQAMLARKADEAAALDAAIGT